MMALSRLSIIKFVELALTVTCVGLHTQSFNADVGTGMLVTGTLIGFLIIMAGTAAGYVLKTPAHKRVDIFYTLVGAALFVASGAVLIDRYKDFSKSEYVRYNLAKGSLAIVNGAVLLIDAVLTQRGG